MSLGTLVQVFQLLTLFFLNMELNTHMVGNTFTSQSINHNPWISLLNDQFSKKFKLIDGMNLIILIYILTFPFECWLKLPFYINKLGQHVKFLTEIGSGTWFELITSSYDTMLNHQLSQKLKNDEKCYTSQNFSLICSPNDVLL
jgi:hypothetical protein